MFKTMAVIIGMFVLSGCASKYDVNVTGYGGQNNFKNQTYDFALSSESKTDLEMIKYVGVLEAQLNCIGWKRNAKNPAYIITPVFGVVLGKASAEPRVSIGGGIGFFSGGIAPGLSLGTAVGRSVSDEDKDMSFLNIKLFTAGNTDKAPVWQGKIFTREKDLSKTAAVLSKYAVENFGKQTDGAQEFTFEATETELKGLEGCPVK
ncbi:MAG: hypothetical protein AB7F25_04840 [Deferribacterales bacterium]